MSLTESIVYEPSRNTPVGNIKTTSGVSLLLLRADEIVKFVPKRGKPCEMRADDLLYYLDCNLNCK